MHIVCSLPAGANLFSSPPPNPKINEPLPSHSKPPPLPPLPKKRSPKSPRNPNPNPNPALKAIHLRTKYHKPISSPVLATDGDRSVVVGESGVSYLLPDAPFEFQFSYSETPKAKPIAIREPAFLPFAPPSMPRPWTGKAPLMSKKEKERKRRIRLFEPLGEEEEEEREGGGRVMRVSGKAASLGVYSKDGRSREEILGTPLTRKEVREFVKPRLSCNRQVNLGRDGLTHNMLELVHTHWRRQEVCKVRCRGVPTIDMDNVCYHLEEKTGGKIIHRVGGVLYLFRGRNYSSRTRPRYPVMLWKPAAPVYPKLIQEAPEGLTKIDANELRKKGQNLLPICKLAKNGIYMTLVKDVRDAFEGSPLVKINCQGMHASDYKKIGAKLKELVPCVLLSFDDEQILMWRGKDWRSMYHTPIPSVSKLLLTESGTSSVLKISEVQKGHEADVHAEPSTDVGIDCMTKKEVFSPKMLSLWNQALDSCKAVLLDETELSPDSLLAKVEEFDGVSLAAEHSYPALILSGETTQKERSVYESNDDSDESVDRCEHNEDLEDYDIDASNLFEDVESSTTPFGSLPVDTIAERLSPELDI